MQDDLHDALPAAGSRRLPGFDALCAIVVEGIEIAHHIRGRIRLRLVEGAGTGKLPEASTNLAQTVQSVLERAPGVRSIRVNRLARCCAVEYDAGILPPAAWGDFLAGSDSADARALRDVLHAAYVEIADHAQL